MKKIFILALAMLTLSIPLFAQTPVPSAQKCDGPPELCQQILELNKKLAVVKQQSVKEAEKKAAELDTKKEQETDDKMARTVALAAAMAVGLKMLLSLLEAWKGYFKDVRGRAALKIITLVVGLIAFIATNVGLGLPFWQSIVLAGGGPGAILVHELTKLIPVLRGKQKTMPESMPPASA